MADPITEDQIEKFVAAWYDALDRHAPLQVFAGGQVGGSSHRAEAVKRVLGEGQEKNAEDETNNIVLTAVYGQLCESYRAVDNFRMGLLGLLPLASGAGIFFLFQREAITSEQQSFLLPIGLFGFVITLGLLLFEVYGIRKCGALIKTGRDLEQQSNIRGQFACRPRSVGPHINEPFASGVIYSAVLAAWAFVALRFEWPAIALLVAFAVFAAGFGGMLAYNIHLGENEPDPEC